MRTNWVGKFNYSLSDSWGSLNQVFADYLDALERNANKAVEGVTEKIDSVLQDKSDAAEEARENAAKALQNQTDFSANYEL